MSNCTDLREQLAAWADGALSQEARAAVEAHLAVCASCQHEAKVQASVHRLLAEGGRATALPPPPWLRTRIEAALAAETVQALPAGWRTRLSAFAAAAMVVLAVGAVALPVVTSQSTVVLAAQLALDHLKCFAIDGDEHTETLAVQAAESELLEEYGWSIDVPPTAGSPEARLVAVRRCLYGDGRAAHLLYRLRGEPVSLFILPGLDRPADSLALFGQDEVIWTDGDRTLVLVAAAGHRPELLRMASNLRNEAE